MIKTNRLIDASEGKMVDGLCLSEQKSMWNMDLYLAVDKEIEGAENVTMSGNYMSKVYEGEYKDMGKWIEDFKKHIESKKVVMEKMLMWYTTCPKCAKKYGKNYTVLVVKYSI
jgi:hypothetical protein